MYLFDLEKYNYVGFKGKFITLGIPVFSWQSPAAINPIIFGNIISLTDSVLKERNGNYLVKSVKTTFSVDAGFRAELELHFRTDSLTEAQLAQGQ